VGGGQGRPSSSNPPPPLQAITNLMRADPASGEALMGQLQLARLPSSSGNTLFTPALQAGSGRRARCPSCQVRARAGGLCV